MERVDVDDVEPMGVVETDRRELTDPLGVENVAINRYELDPGEAFSGGLHAHLDQEELFYVFQGTATFETEPTPDAAAETVEVGPEEAIRSLPASTSRGTRRATTGSWRWRRALPAGASSSGSPRAVPSATPTHSGSTPPPTEWACSARTAGTTWGPPTERRPDRSRRYPLPAPGAVLWGFVDYDPVDAGRSTALQHVRRRPRPGVGGVDRRPPPVCRVEHLRVSARLEDG